LSNREYDTFDNESCGMAVMKLGTIIIKKYKYHERRLIPFILFPAFILFLFTISGNEAIKPT